MAQQDPNSFPIDPFTTSGIELATIMNELNSARVSGEAGTSRPSYAVQGYTWLDVTNAKNLLKFYTGTVDLSILEYDTTNNKAIINGGSGFTDKSRSIIHKFSEVTGVQPVIADMVKGEFYLNSADGVYFYLDNNGALKSIGAVNTQNVEAPSMSIGGDFLSPFGLKNKLINGNFSMWQRATSQTTTEYGSDDRWSNEHVGTTKTHSRQTATDTERAVFNSNFFSRTVVTSVAGVTNFCAKSQAIEDVTKLAGKTITISFWAKADIAKNIAIEFNQRFGTGGTPSATVIGIDSQLIALTATWTKYSITVSLPSIVGKTLGTDGIHTSATQIFFWFDAGSNYDARTASLGQQSGTFDIAEVQLEEGSVATPFEQRPIGLEEILCRRYYQIYISTTIRLTPIADNKYIYIGLPLDTPMRTNSPTLLNITYTPQSSTWDAQNFAVNKYALNGYARCLTGALNNTSTLAITNIQISDEL